ncbi:ribonuclease R family protein [Allohahella marinimesophila]|uniref:Exoribonuclease II n=1 Tax=Allohahella marinimesophila TaxID=1054972 RepID=A0ABP7PD62_9GAMM
MLDISALSQLRELKSTIRQSNNQFEGVVRGSNGSFGFLTIKPGQDTAEPTAKGEKSTSKRPKEAFLSPAEMLKILPGDTVLAEISQDSKGRDVATVISVLQSSARYFTGRYVQKGKGHFVETQIEGTERRLFITPKKRKTAKPGDYIVARLLKHPFPDGRAQTEVLRILGNDQTAGIETKLAQEVFNIRPGKTRPEAATCEARFEQKSAGRVDLTAEPFFTIDGESTQDMDDALFITKTEDGHWVLKVAITDVAAWIDPGSDLDKESAELASSWYFPHKTVPMLPGTLSHQWCSLQHGQARLAMVASMSIGSDGELVEGTSLSFEQAIIRSQAKVSYNQLNEWQQAPESFPAGLPDTVTAQFQDALALGDVLRQWRRDHALLMDHRPDYRTTLNDDGKILSVRKEIPGPAERLVEECMVRTNLETARLLAAEAPAAIFSEHAGFKPERLKQVRHIIREQLPELAAADPAPDPSTLEGYTTIMKAAQALESELPVFAILSRLQTRSRLTTTPAPHHSMGLSQYLTVTSPLRKYADLCTQRVLCALSGEGRVSAAKVDIDALSASLLNGRRAVALAEQKLQQHFAAGLSGQRFTATIVQVNGSGFIARIEDNGVEGFVDLGALPQAKFRLDSTYFRQVGQQISFMLDQSVDIIVKGLDKESGRVLFDLAEDVAADTPQEQASAKVAKTDESTAVEAKSSPAEATDAGTSGDSAD